MTAGNRRRAVLLGHGHDQLSHQARGKGISPRIERTEGWSRSGNLLTSAITPSQRLVSLAKTFPHPGQYTVQFSLHAIDQINGKIECNAIVEWSTAGNTVTREVSVIPGMSISGTADSIRVRMFDATSTDSDGEEYQVSALITPGTRAVTGLPPLLYPPYFLNGGPNNPIVLAPGNQQTYDIPQGIGIVGVSVIAGNSSPIGVTASIPEQQAQVFQFGPGINPLLRRYDARMFEVVPLVPGATSVAVRNGTAALGLIFGVAWAIDG